MKYAALLLNRFTLSFGAIALVAFGWNLYVAQHDGGLLSGRVTTPDGKPVAGASVVLSRRTVTSVERVASELTDAQGRFEFRDHGQYAVVLTARKPEVGAAARRTERLWFRNQDRVLDQPLVLVP